MLMSEGQPSAGLTLTAGLCALTTDGFLLVTLELPLTASQATQWLARVIFERPSIIPASTGSHYFDRRTWQPSCSCSPGIGMLIESCMMRDVYVPHNMAKFRLGGVILRRRDTTLGHVIITEVTRLEDCKI